MFLTTHEQRQSLAADQNNPLDQSWYRKVSKLFYRKSVLLLGGSSQLCRRANDYEQYDIIFNCNYHFLKAKIPRCDALFCTGNIPLSNLDGVADLKLLGSPIQLPSALQYAAYCKQRDIVYAPYLTQPHVRNPYGASSLWSWQLANKLDTIPLTGIIALAFLLAEPWRYKATGAHVAGYQVGGYHTPEDEAAIPALAIKRAMMGAQEAPRVRQTLVDVDCFSFYIANRRHPERISGHDIPRQIDWFIHKLDTVSSLKASSYVNSCIANYRNGIYADQTFEKMYQ